MRNHDSISSQLSNITRSFESSHNTLMINPIEETMNFMLQFIGMLLNNEFCKLKCII